MPEDPSRPLRRVWVPGVCIVEGQTIRVGLRVGWHTRRGIDDWKMGARIYAKADATSLPESRIDVERYPRLHAVATLCPAVAELADDDFEQPDSPRHMLATWHRVGGGGTLEMRGGGEPSEGFSGEFPGRLRAPSRRFTEDDYRDRYVDFDLSSDVTIDAAIQAISGGHFDEASVELAVELADAAGSPSRMQAWESWLASVEERAAEQRDDAEALAEFVAKSEALLLSAAEADEELPDVRAPRYGEINAHWIPALLMARDDASEPGDDAIALRARVEFSIPRASSDVEPDWPPPFVLQPAGRRSAPGRVGSWLIPVLLLVAATVIVARCG